MKSDRWYNSAIGQKPFPISPPPSPPLLLFSFSLSPFFIILIFPYFYPSLFSLFLFLSAPSCTGTDAGISAPCGSGRVNPRHLCFKAEGRRQEGASTTFFFFIVIVFFLIHSLSFFAAFVSFVLFVWIVLDSIFCDTCVSDL